MADKERVVTREELYKLVWSKPITILAKEFGMSDVGLAKVCKKLRVPKPYRGYWQLVDAGRKVTIPPLPPARKGDSTKATISPEHYRVNFKPEDANVMDRMEAENRPENEIKVQETLNNPHRLVRNTQILLRKGKPDETGRLRCWMVNDTRPRLSVRVSKDTVHRALLILDALVKALEVRGCTVEANDATVCRIGETVVPFYIWERVRRTERPLTDKDKERAWLYNRWQFIPTGELVFTLDEFCVDRKNWADGKNKKLEHKLNSVVAGLFAAAEQLRLREIERREEEVRRAEAERKRAEMEHQRWIQEERGKQLDRLVTSWTRSNHLRQFLNECEQSLTLQDENRDVSGEYWLKWARAYADAIDPFKNGWLQQIMDWS
jgi:hypothetical protein